jgi:hypothetical protein
LLIVLQAADLGVLHLLNQRLYLADVLRFANDLAGDWSVLRSQLFALNGAKYLVAVLAILTGVAGLLAAPSREPVLGLRVWLIAAVIAAAFASFAVKAPLRYVHESFAGNLLVVNLPQGRTKRLSPAFAHRVERLSQAVPKTCAPGNRTGLSVIVVITESLSAYQSALLGGPRNWLPRLDALARANHYFTHFYANGFTTDGGEIALLTGRLPVAKPGALYYEFTDFAPDANTLVSIAHRAGYDAAYFTATDLDFIGSRTWLQKLGFDHIEGNENPYYANLPKGQFGSAEDAALFGRFAQWLDQRQDPRPFVAVLLTISSHPPFLNPRTGKIDPQGTFGYIDDQLAEFHAALARRGFLDHGILVITGDHRSMTPLSREEYAMFGERAYARIPLIVAGALDMPRIVDTPFQQSDFPASLAKVLGVNYCRTPFNGIFLDAKPQPGQFILQARGDDRDRVDVYYGDRVASYRKNGDAGGWQDAPPPEAAMVSAWIEAQRLRNQEPARAGP